MPGRIPGCVGSPRAAHRAAAPGAVLSGAGYLSQAEALFAAHPSITRDQQPAAALCEQFDRLRWFELPRSASPPLSRAVTREEPSTRVQAAILAHPVGLLG
jgi:hypothetical protein